MRIDRKTDPHEIKSVYGDPAFAEVQAELHKRLEELREELGVKNNDIMAQ